jgi:hypothetical protein
MVLIRDPTPQLIEGAIEIPKHDERHAFSRMLVHPGIERLPLLG